jgi:hypothetical protein
MIRNITRWGYGWNAHYKRMNGDYAAEYLSKYLMKPWPDFSADEYRILSKARIVSQSNDLPPIFAHESDWELVRDEVCAGMAVEVLNILIGVLKFHGSKNISSRPF